MPFFSIIVPVYNVDVFLKECIESILLQSFNDYEMILIDDGSTDNSGIICDEYESSNRDRVRVIHKENGGLSDARNVGIGVAKGQYLIFVDSDDYISPESLQIFREELSKYEAVDVLITRLMQVYIDGQTKYMDKNMPIDKLLSGKKAEVIEWIFKDSQNTWPAQRYVVNRDFIYKYNLKFACGYLHEDLDWSARLFLYASSFSCLGYYWYAHRMRRVGSITNTPNVKRVLDVIELVAKNIGDDDYMKLDADLRKTIFQRLIYSLYAALNKYKYMDKQDKTKIRNLLEHNREVFKYTRALRHQVFLFFSVLFGFRFAFYFMNIIHRQGE
ncbi:glycosyltransferase [Desulfosporosinus fructosivorans]|uniref:Glycosyltransferase n=1 Tax=Desulfosporosinus fructosivorans TaxID=2018669 RepID=A0A4Z0QVK2_9FIRM|nr:glycosyltransferase [Desulfosporosinus fructosivorans]TGE34861.1 glycosyltransferase [Desulfosporosinus fructosivorans]